jgi:hypothetical protein
MGDHLGRFEESLEKGLSMVLPRCLVALVYHSNRAEIAQVDLPKGRFWNGGREYNILSEACFI